MADEPAKIFLGDTAISAIEQPPGMRGLFRRKNRQLSPKSHCENCGADLRGDWCSQCGQVAVDYHRSFRYVIWDVLDSFLNWDSKFFATIGLLIAKPWCLTNDFVAGKRVRYFHPLRLYLLASILFFFAVNHWAKSIHFQTGKFSPEERATAQARLQAELERKDLPAPARVAMEQALAAISPTPEASIPSKETAGPFLQMDDDKPSTPFEKWLTTRAKEKIGEHGSNAELFLATLFQNLPYMMLCCIPLFALVLKILYVRRRDFYINHLIYALHIHAFAYVGIILIVYATIGLGRLSSGPLFGWAVAILWVAFATQVFLSIRKVYGQGWFLSIFKFLFGGLVYLIVLFSALLVTFFVTIALP